MTLFGSGGLFERGGSGRGRESGVESVGIGNVFPIRVEGLNV